jgi:hypothetical protein
MTQGTFIASAIKGFNREWAAVQSVKAPRGETIGYRLVTECGKDTRYLDKHFNDPYGAACMALELHKCSNVNRGEHIAIPDTEHYDWREKERAMS